MIITLTQEQMDDILGIAQLRHRDGAIKGGWNRDKKSESQRNYEGVLGEYAMAEYLGAEIDREARPKGDGGRDLEVVSTEGKMVIGVRYTVYFTGKLYQDTPYPRPDLLVLTTKAHGQDYITPWGDPFSQSVRLNGWIRTAKFVQEYTKHVSHGRDAWFVEQDKLHPIDILKDRTHPV